MTQKQWKQNQRIQNQKIYNRRIKKAFLPVTSGLLAFMVMVGGCALPGNSGQDTGTDYADMLTEARQIATGRMVKDAEALGADAIVGMGSSSQILLTGILNKTKG